MKALVYEGAGKKSWQEVAERKLSKPTDAIVKVLQTTLCGTDLHIMKGDLPAVTPGRILGHEAVGIVTEIGSAISRFKVGDRVIVSCITSCGTCPNCKRAMYSHCEDGGWILGYLIDGTQAESVLIPHADNSLYAVPAGSNEEALVMLSDILPTGFECGVLNGQIKPGDTVAIVGAGPVGLAALMTAKFYSPAEIIMVDLDDNRLEVAKGFGATQLVNSKDGTAAARIMKLTQERGVEVAIEAVGTPATFDICQAIVGPGGHLANIGVHGKSVELHMEKLWSQNITLTTRLVDASTTPMLLKTVLAKSLKPEQLITHRFQMSDILKAYDTFGNAARERALKVLISAPH